MERGETFEGRSALAERRSDEVAIRGTGARGGSRGWRINAMGWTLRPNEPHNQKDETNLAYRFHFDVRRWFGFWPAIKPHPNRRTSESSFARCENLVSPASQSGSTEKSESSSL